MARYNESEAVVPECEGCDKVFEHIQVVEEGEFPIITDKCLAYAVPAAKWPRKDEVFAMREATIRVYDEKGKPSTEDTEIPIVPKACPLATHFKLLHLDRAGAVPACPGIPCDRLIDYGWYTRPSSTRGANIGRVKYHILDCALAVGRMAGFRIWW